MKKTIISLLTAVILVFMTACGTTTTTNRTAAGAGIGAGSGAAIGALAGILLSSKSDRGKGAVIGAAIGTAVGGGAGAAIGHHMDKKAAALQAELEKQAQVETVTDGNGLTAIKVTFDSGILFATGKSTLSSAAKQALVKFAQDVTQQDLLNTDILIKGHTDTVGSREVNEKLSFERAQAVGNLLRANGVTTARITEAGLAYDEPVASNDTEAGRAQNRRVEVFLLANAAMVQQAEAGQL